MKLLGSGLLGRTIKTAGICTAPMWTVSVGHAQSGPRKQTVQISSKGKIKGVHLTMVRG